MVGGFELAVWPVCRVGFVMEAAISERTTKALVEEQEQEGDVQAFCRQAVSVVAAIALEQIVPFQLAQVVAQLVETVSFGGKLERSANCLVNLFFRPAPDRTSLWQENSPN